MSRALVALIGSVLAIAVMFALLSRNNAIPISSDGESAEPVMLFCAASNRSVMERILSDYRAEFGRDVVVQYGASQTLLSQLEVTGTGDLYLPADDSYLAMAREKNLVTEILPVARMRVVAAVAKGNPKQVESIEDLFRSDVRVVQAAPDATAIGKVTRQTLMKTGDWEKLDKATAAYRGTVTEAANDIVVGAADAAIVFEAVLYPYEGLESVQIRELEPAVSEVVIGVAKNTTNSQAAFHLARYITARDRGLKHYAEQGFQVSLGDKWSNDPELKLFAGSMLRPAIEQTIKEFQEREGVRVATVYNGCGILVAQMKAGQVPDAYFACDTEFMKQVPDLFPEPIDVSQNELVILVQKGNPEGIGSLKDLTKQGLKVGIGHEKQCAMGWLTQNTFREGGVQQEVMENVTVQTPTGDMLVNQMRTGSLDAAVVYLSNAAGSGEFLDAVRIDGLPCAIATQPYAVKPDSPNAATAARLFRQICSAQSQADFAAEGFRWKSPATDKATQTVAFESKSKENSAATTDPAANSESATKEGLRGKND
jgi:molybdate transport system substrate-binding protein